MKYKQSAIYKNTKLNNKTMEYEPEEKQSIVCKYINEKINLYDQIELSKKLKMMNCVEMSETHGIEMIKQIRFINPSVDDIIKAKVMLIHELDTEMKEIRIKKLKKIHNLSHEIKYKLDTLRGETLQNDVKNEHNEQNKKIFEINATLDKIRREKFSTIDFEIKQLKKIITTTDESSIIPPKHGFGIIYKMTCTKTKKSYVGQANNYTSGNTIWRHKRIDSHFTEALQNTNDHCRLLNEAIRKHGKDSFTNEIIDEFSIKELDDKETYYIKKFETLYPNGYNLLTGGSRPEMSSDYSNPRKHDADNSLPKYINGIYDNNILVGYSVNGFPIGGDKPKYLKKEFRNSNKPTEAFNRAISYLENLRKVYGGKKAPSEKYFKEKCIENFNRIHEKIKVRSEYVYPNFDENYIHTGFYVENVPKAHGGVYEKELFDKLSSNIKNLEAALRLIEHLNVKNKDALFDESTIVGNSFKFKRSSENKYLPQYVAYVKNPSGDIIGYAINNFPMADGQKMKKKFCDTTITREEKFKSALKYLAELNEKNQKLKK